MKDGRGMTDQVTLTLPREREFAGVANLVVGGLAVRLNLTYEQLEDLEVALDGLLSTDEGDDEVTVALRFGDGHIRASVGPFRGESLLRELDAQPDEAWSLRRVLETVADTVEIGERDGGHWVELTKAVHPAPREST